VTGVWIAAIAGALVAAGVVGIVWYLIPASVDVVDGLDRLTSIRAAFEDLTRI